jgi:NDP-sugar pyrophosphorylase family protein
MNILIPMNGLGSRFKPKFKNPKPLISYLGKSIFEHSVDTIGINGKFIFLIPKYEDEKYNLLFLKKIKKLKNESITIVCEKKTDGSVETCLLAEEIINNNDELLIVNCDHFLNWNGDLFLNFIHNENLDCCVTTYNHGEIILNEKSPYSFAKLNDDGFVIETKEKTAISSHSMNGIHYWKKGSDFIESAKNLIKNDIKTNNEFYLSETFNYLINNGKKMKIFKMEDDNFFSLGTPEDLIKNKNKIKKIIKKK